MLDRLIDLVLNFIQLFYFTVVINDYEQGVVLRFGRYHRTIGPGLHFKIPFGIEKSLAATVVYDTMGLNDRSITLKDGVTIGYRIAVGFTIKDIRKYLLEVDGAEAAIVDSVAMLAPDVIGLADWPTIQDPETRSELSRGLLRVVKRRCGKFGIEIESLALTNLSKCRMYYLIQQNGWESK